MGLPHTVGTLFAQGSDPLESSGPFIGNALTVAVEYGHLDIVELLLSKDLTIDKRSAENLMCRINHEYFGKAKLEAIFNLTWDLGLLFDKSKIPDKIIEEGIIVRTIWNRHCGLELLRLVLDRRHEACIPITDRVLRCALIDSAFKEEMLGLLFERCNEDIHISPSFFADLDKYNLGCSIGVYSGIDVILMKRATELRVDDDSVAYWARNASSKAMGFMLRTHADIRVTEQTLRAAASNELGVDMIRLLFDRRELGTQISETVLLTAATNSEGQDVVKFLLAKLSPTSPVTERMILCVAEKIHYRKSLKALIEELSPTTPLTEKVSENLVMNGLATVKLVIDRQQAGFVISEGMMEIAASHESDAIELLRMLRTKGGAKVLITEPIVCAAAANYERGSSVIEYLFQVQGDGLPITENVLAAATGNPEALETILNKRPGATITDAVYEAAFQVLELIVEQHLVDVDAWAVETVACNCRCLELLLSRKPDVPITHQALIRATEDPDSVRLPLEAEKNHSLVTEEVMMAAVRSHHNLDSMRSILRRVDSAPITRNVLTQAMYGWNLGAAEFILSEQPDLDLKANFELTESILQGYPYDWELKNDYGFDDMIQKLCRYRVPIHATEGMGVIVLERCFNAVAEKFLEYCPNVPITDKLFQTVERNPRVSQVNLLSLLAGKRDSA
ncbi:hypothetical protein BDV27DRAFT_148251 [Aspergillus caelatus]|uniref:Ankyrin repeat-containing domain protein n=1 Tax=Aspergillus caelatus TaxID=61420 RepID=A0A5N6ZVG3_9EURO|nr:uncharacterized protein BDV27DRAFT_148251 [Aspergillus caelatus]KAE8360919.1 hypothetical protein BDV27DRAFT_148251 [Aspergillus caelatus]